MLLEISFSSPRNTFVIKNDEVILIISLITEDSRQREEKVLCRHQNDVLCYYWRHHKTFSIELEIAKIQNEGWGVGSSSVLFLSCFRRPLTWNFISGSRWNNFKKLVHSTPKFHFLEEYKNNNLMKKRYVLSYTLY